MAATGEALILASASAARAALLHAAGIEFAIRPAQVDEASLKRLARQAGEPAMACAMALAALKARAVSLRFPAALVIGADQILSVANSWFDKPVDLVEARGQLLALRGKTHVLATAACVMHDGTVLWQATSAPELVMRDASDGFLDRYIAAEGEALLGSVGAYLLEGRGVQLFARISGDHFAVLGLPLLELLGFLRERGAIAA